jgi:hypothetical protein
MAHRFSGYNLDFVDTIPPIRPNSRVGVIGDRSWGINDTPFRQYTADAVFPHYPGGLEDIIQERIGYSDTNVGLDLAGGSQGRALRDLIKDGILTKGLVTNLEDLRTHNTKSDTRLNHIAGDLAIRQTWEDIIDWQAVHAPDGLSLIMHRPMGGLQHFSQSTYRRAAHTLVDMLRPGGIFFTQVPRYSDPSRHSQPIRYDQLTRPNIEKTICQELLARPDIEQIISTEPATLRPGKPHFSIIIKNNQRIVERP